MIDVLEGGILGVYKSLWGFSGYVIPKLSI